MVYVVLNSWRPGLRKIPLNKLLRARTGMGLAEAKRAVDDLLTGNPVEIRMPDRASAEALLAEAMSLGAVGEIRQPDTEGE
jgi:ribosomal protein L7/L12